jgi:Lrp/AsnC family transcriptional regulator for asnA, asnC and gidA
MSPRKKVRSAEAAAFPSREALVSAPELESQRGSGAFDLLDYTIIGLLQEDGRRSNASIARAAGVSESTTKKRIDRLIQSRVLKLLAVVDPDALGFAADALVGIRVQPGSVERVGEELCALNEVVWLGYLSGRYDILIEVLYRNRASLFEFLSRRIGAIDGVVTLETYFVYARPKINYEWKLPSDLDSLARTVATQLNRVE